MRKKNLYRKWDNPDEATENHLMITPEGVMVQITKERDLFGDKFILYRTSPARNRLSPEVFTKHKEVCSKAEWIAARDKVIKLLKA